MKTIMCTLITCLGLTSVLSQDVSNHGLPIQLISSGNQNTIIIQGNGSPLISAVKTGNLKAVKVLVEKGADVNERVKLDGSPLIEASKLGYLDIVKYLISKNADVNIHVEGDETPLIRAAWNGHLNVVKYLVEHGADINKTVREGYRLGAEKRNPLRMAKKGKHKAVIAYLISNGATQ